MPPTNIINPDAERVDRLLKTIEDILVPVAEKAIQTTCPDLALPVIKQAVDLIVQGASNELTKLAQTGATFLIIDEQVDNEVSGISRALAALIQAEKGGNSDAIKSAIKAYADAQSDLGRDDGGVLPSA